MREHGVVFWVEERIVAVRSRMEFIQPLPITKVGGLHPLLDNDALRIDPSLAPDIIVIESLEDFLRWMNALDVSRLRQEFDSSLYLMKFASTPTWESNPRGGTVTVVCHQANIPSLWASLCAAFFVTITTNGQHPQSLPPDLRVIGVSVGVSTMKLWLGEAVAEADLLSITKACTSYFSNTLMCPSRISIVSNAQRLTQMPRINLELIRCALLEKYRKRPERLRTAIRSQQPDLYASCPEAPVDRPKNARTDSGTSSASTAVSSIGRKSNRRGTRGGKARRKIEEHRAMKSAQSQPAMFECSLSTQEDSMANSRISIPHIAEDDGNDSVVELSDVEEPMPQFAVACSQPQAEPQAEPQLQPQQHSNKGDEQLVEEKAVAISGEVVTLAKPVQGSDEMISTPELHDSSNCLATPITSPQVQSGKRKRHTRKVSFGDEEPDGAKVGHSGKGETALKANWPLKFKSLGLLALLLTAALIARSIFL